MSGPAKTTFLGVLAAAGIAAAALPQTGADAEERFRQAAALSRAGDSAGAVRIYRELAAAKIESASLYWNWAHVALGRGAHGEALWALLRARELNPADRAVTREIDRVRELRGLDPAELSPHPFAGLGRWSRHLCLDLAAVALLVLSLVLHALARFRRALRWPVAAAWTTAALAIVATALFVAGNSARPTAVVVRPEVSLLDAASPTASVLTTLREGEVVPVLEESGPFLRVQDSSGARGWAPATDLWRLDRPPTARETG